ncbi:hypothetical protein SESBI_47073 [Sesbania bispinosa]|nr:hypothetical protein SESBI_47073 [Sesbania bispinosa]
MGWGGEGLDEKEGMKEGYVPGDIGIVVFGIKANVGILGVGVTEENARLRSRLKFGSGVWFQPGETKATKGMKMMVVGWSFKKHFKG